MCYGGVGLMGGAVRERCGAHGVELRPVRKEGWS